MTNGIIVFAHNSSKIDYLKLAVFAAKRAVSYLELPISVVTDSKDWLIKNYPDHPFDQIIESWDNTSLGNLKQFHDGALSTTQVNWKNQLRSRVYDITPYDTTLVIDSDYIISSSVLKTAFDNDYDFQIYRKSVDLAAERDNKEFKRINQYSVPFYWATAFIFKKSTITQAFFDLIVYIKENWLYFRNLYNIESPLFRNDFAFSIAIHIMNGKTNGDFAIELPGTMTYISDKDLLVEIDNDKMKFLVEKKNFKGEYLAAKTNGVDVHIMNKISLSRFIDGGSGV
jgi:hypothetical protein